MMNQTLPILTAAQMYACDAYTIQTLGVPSRTLMERAARQTVQFLIGRDDLFPCRPTLLLCGSGNNGGDGFAAARFLTDGSFSRHGADGVRPVAVLYTGREDADGCPDTARMSEECLRQYRMARDAGVRVTCLSALDPTDAGALLSLLADGEGKAPECLTVVDAVLGIGLDRAVTGRIGALFDTVNRAGWATLAVDIPSGVVADSGSIPGAALRAAATVTMQALKPGHVLYPGADACGELCVADLGIRLDPVNPVKKSSCDTLSSDPTVGQITMYLTGGELLRMVMPPRARRSNKGSYGRVGLICGSVGMCGAALLATSAALHSGVGLAQVVTPKENRTVVQTALPEAILSVYDGEAPEDADLRCLLMSPDGTPVADGYVVGCGLGTSPAAVRVLTTFLDACPAEGGASVPIVLDADALNIISRNPSLWLSRALCAPDRRVVITPHPAEMARLTGQSVRDVLTDLPGTAKAFAAAHGVTVVLKDAHTVVASPDGQVFVCTAGNAGMAKGGSGDVLAGLVGSLLTQNRKALTDGEVTVTEVAAAAVWLHATAGDRAAEVKGEYAMLPSDLIAALPEITKRFSDTRTGVTAQ